MAKSETVKDAAMRAKEAKARTNITVKLNEALANLDLARSRVHKATCELGTARAEEAKAIAVYKEALAAFHDLLPSLDPDPVPVVASVAWEAD